jgi:hypothetical protein
MPALPVWTPRRLARRARPLRLAIAAGSALVVDLDPGGPRYPGRPGSPTSSATGVRRPDLEPFRAWRSSATAGSLRSMPAR